jgi:predicted nucleotidyltransferase
MRNPSIENLETVAEGLGDLIQEIVFIGGATAGFYVTNPGAPEARPTMDVDCIVELASYAKLAELETKLTKMGFRHDTSKGAPICRWVFRDIKVDIMPTDPDVMGFSNRWYEDGIKHAVETELPDKKKIRIFTAPYFIGSKIEAYNNRGKKDMRTSPDFEDIVYVLDNRNEIVQELLQAEDNIREYVQQFLVELLNNPDSNEGIAATLPAGTGQAGVDRIRRIMSEIVASEN